VPHDQAGGAWDDGSEHGFLCSGYQPTQPVVTVPDNGPGTDYTLSSFPNPFNAITTIRFTLKESNFTELTVFNSLGAEVAALYQGVAQATQVYQVEFDGSNLPAGIYYYRLSSGNKINSINKLILLK
jgi:hypothetical protein